MITADPTPDFWSSPVLLQLIAAVVTIFTLVWNTRSQKKATAAVTQTATVVTEAAAAASGAASAAKVISEDNGQKLDANSEKLEVVHQLVNGERHGMMDRIAQLEGVIADCDECKAALKARS